MNETKLNWQNLQLFLDVAQAEGLAGASRSTGMSSPTLGRRMLALENSTGRELFRRHTHGYELTVQGQELLEVAMKLQALIDPLDHTRRKSSSQIVKVSAGSWMSRALCQRIGEIIEHDEDIRIRFISAEHRLDIAHRETIIGIRNQRPDKTGVATRKIGRVKFAGYAVSNIVEHWILVNGTTPSSQWLASQPVNQIAQEVTAPINALDLALAGAGRVLLPTFVGDSLTELVQVTPTVGTLSHDQWLVVHQDERHQPQVRKVIDRLYKVAKTLHSSRNQQ